MLPSSPSAVAAVAPPAFDSRKARREHEERVLADPDLIEDLCDFVAENGTLSNWCASKGLRYRVAVEWLASHDVRQKAFDLALKARDYATRDSVRSHLEAIAAVDPRRAFNEEGRPLPLRDLPADLALAAESTTTADGAVIRFNNRLKALESIGRSVAMFTERHELTGKDGQPIKMQGVTLTPEQMRSMTDADLEALERVFGKVDTATS